MTTSGTKTSAASSDIPKTILSSELKPNLVGIVLAAGRASRFGSDKRQAHYDGQHTMLSRAIDLIVDHCSQVFVVTRPGDEAQSETLLGPYQNNPKIEQIIASDAIHGMGSSLANGIAQVIANEKQTGQLFSGALIALADMPYIREQTIKQLVDEFDEDKISIPCYLEPHKEKKWGNPVLFSRKWFDALNGLRGDRGARALIKSNPCARIEVVVDDPGILRDVDTPADLDVCA